MVNLLLATQPGDGWILLDGVRPHRLFCFRLSSSIGERVFMAQRVVHKQELSDGGAVLQTLVEEDVERMIAHERKKSCAHSS